MDMSVAFVAGSMTHLPDSQIIFDKFHLVQSLNKALDEVRKREREGNGIRCLTSIISNSRRGL
ncbi:hypothetical protein AwDysgo_21320 [Bacteroidales bacterium]|nr:hypothetical protein AwDysgo_21320 [Bacteroidales bacterium]